MRTSVVIISASMVLFSLPYFTLAQELVPDTVVTMKARVVEVLTGLENGTMLTIENDFLELEVGNTFNLNHTTSNLDGTDYYSPVERVRTPALILLSHLFVALVIAFGGKQGMRGLLALVASFIFIGAMLAGIMQGYSPVLVSVGTASLIVLIGSYVTHGFNRTTSAAVVGMISHSPVSPAGAATRLRISI